jgi:hypothetical protein
MAGEFDAADPATWTPCQREQMDIWRRRHNRNHHECRIAEWVARQQVSYDWVNFAEIADWCAREPGGVRRDEDRRAQAFRDLSRSVTAGEFSRAGRWCVVRPPEGATPLSEPLRLRVTLAWLRKWPAFHGGMTIPDRELARWWVPRDLCAAWFERRQIAPLPWLSEGNEQRTPHARQPSPGTPTDAHMPIIRLNAALTHFAADQRLAARYAGLSLRQDLNAEEYEERVRAFLVLSDDLLEKLRKGHLCARGYWTHDRRRASPPAEWWTDARINIADNTATARYETLAGIQVYRPAILADLFSMLAKPTQAAAPVVGADHPVGKINNGGRAASDCGATYRAGLLGRPTSWHLIEGKCRQRYQAGERYPNNAGREVTTEWARVLGAWLSQNHPDAAPVTQKTLSNKLAGLLRELQAATPAKP